MKIRAFITLGIALVLAGCATGYQSSGLRGGHSETRLGENVWQVSFRGNGYTSAERAADFALLRAAEVARANGYPFFIVVSLDNRERVSSYTTPTTTTGSATITGNTITGSATTIGGQTYLIVRPSARNTIVGLKDKPEGVVYEAEYVVQSIRAKYGM